MPRLAVKLPQEISGVEAVKDAIKEISWRLENLVPGVLLVEIFGRDPKHPMIVSGT